MNIRLDKLNIAYLTSTKYPDRDRDTKQMLDSLGLKYHRFDGGVTKPYTIGVCTGHLMALEALGTNSLLIEDDGRLTNKSMTSSFSVEVPDDADAVYFGTSLYGRIKNTTIYGSTIGLKVLGYNDIFKTVNMLSMHGIVYISERYLNHTKDLLKTFLANPIGAVDDRIAELQDQYNIYALKNPILYQNDGHSDTATLTPVQLLNT